MARALLLPLCLGLLSLCCCSADPAVDAADPGNRYEPTWESLDSRPLPSWYDDAKFGIFIHWGVYSVPAYSGEWLWYNWKVKQDPDVVRFMETQYPGWAYQAFAPLFTARLFDPATWVELFEAAGARYIVTTAKHHDGYTLYPSAHSANWNSDVGPGRDLLAELQAAVHADAPNLRFGLYHSLYEWFHPLYLQDKANNWTSQAFVTQKSGAELYELVERYQPDMIWSDGDWEAPDSYWNATAFLAWLYNDSPVKDTVVTNDRWGQGTACQHGGFLTCEDRYSPGEVQARKYESCQTLDKKSWGYRRNARLEDFLSFSELLATLVTTVATNGNLLLNVGPDSDGLIHPIFEERLRQLGGWLRLHGWAIYGTRPWRVANDSVAAAVWYTSYSHQETKEEGDARSGSNLSANAQGSTTVYAIILNWPEPNNRETLVLGAPRVPSDSWLLTSSERRRDRRRQQQLQTTSPVVSLVGCDDDVFVPWEARDEEQGGGIMVDLRSVATCTNNRPEGWAWVLALRGFE